MNILALDLGSKLGFAIYSNDSIESGTKKLSRKTFGSRFSEFRCWLMKIITQNQIDIVYFERVYRHNGTEAAHIFGGFMYILASVCDELHIRCEGVSVGTIKKYISGKGNASKVDVIDAVKRHGFDPIDDNEADALSVLFFGLQVLGKLRNKKSLRVLPSSDNQRFFRPRHFASDRTFSMDDRQNAEFSRFVQPVNSKPLDAFEVIDND